MLFHENIVRLRVLFNQGVGATQLIVSPTDVSMVLYVAVPGSKHIQIGAAQGRVIRIKCVLFLP